MRTLVREENDTGILIIEADSPAEALGELSSRIGAEARIESARRITRGGVAGFFARERFEVRARRAGGLDPEALIDLGGADMAIAATEPAEQVEAGEPTPGVSDFSEALQDALFGAQASPAPETASPAAAIATKEPSSQMEVPVPPPPPPNPPPSAPPTAAPAWRLTGPPAPRAPGMGRIDWSPQSLLSIGLPSVIVDAVSGLDPRDDLGWINGIADAVAPLCTPLPTAPALVVGSGVEMIAAPLGIPYLGPPDRPVDEESVAAPVADTERDVNWLQAVKGGRGIHIVIADEPWMHLLVDDPIAVSFVKDGGVVDALYVALTLGCPLGYGIGEGGRIVRLSPIDVALAVRRLVGRR